MNQNFSILQSAEDQRRTQFNFADAERALLAAGQEAVAIAAFGPFDLLNDRWEDYVDFPEHGQPYDGGGWPGDGSGTDDLADYNQNEANDYRDES